MYRPENLSIDGTRFLGRWNGIVPVYDVFTMQGLNAIVGCVKHNNAAYGTVLYRGQTELHPKLIPSILHGNPDREERKRREKEVNLYVKNILSDTLMQGTLHFGDDLEERANYKKIVVEAMLQHYGVRTYCHDFVDNHWTALWFSLYELKKEREKDQSKKTDYYNYYYQKRKPFLNKKCPKPACLELDAVKKVQLPDEPDYEDETDPEFEKCNAYKNLIKIENSDEKEKKLEHARQVRITGIKSRNERNRENWEKQKQSIKLRNNEAQLQYERDKCSNISYAYLILYVADTQGECFRGVYAGTETMTIDLRKALPSVILRPCAQHGWIVKKLSRDGDLSRNVSCVLRMQVDLVDRMLGNGELVQQKNFFPSIKEDSGYRILLGREQIAPFGNPKHKSKKDEPSLFPYSTFQHYIEK